MKHWKKIALIALLVFLLFQIPFIYRRTRLGRLYSVIQQLNSQHIANQALSPHVDYKGVLHVHSSLGGHSTGSENSQGVKIVGDEIELLN